MLIELPPMLRSRALFVVRMVLLQNKNNNTMDAWAIIQFDDTIKCRLSSVIFLFSNCPIGLRHPLFTSALELSQLVLF